MNGLTRILCVEDDADIGFVARLALEAVGGFTVRLCSSGPEALAALPDFAPDLVILDVMMPGMDGPATLVELRKTASQVAVAFMTAKVQPREVSRYRELGAIGVIMKPFDPMTLSDEVRSIWNEHVGREEEDRKEEGR